MEPLLRTGTNKKQPNHATNAEVTPMRPPRLHTYPLFVLLMFTTLTFCTVEAYEGHWIVTGQDYIGYFEPLTGNSQWVFNATRGPNERWGINFTISGLGLHPTTFIVCDEVQYNQWLDTGFIDYCQYTNCVNYSLHTTIDLPHNSSWYLVLNNTGPITLYFTLRITRYQWSTDLSTTPSSPLTNMSSLFIYLLAIGLIVFVVIPCICNFNCIRFGRRRSKREVETKEVQNQTTIMVITPEQLKLFNDDDDH